MPVLLNLARYDGGQIRRWRRLLAAAVAALLLLAAAQTVVARHLFRGGSAEGSREAALTREVERLRARLGAIEDRLAAEDRQALAARIVAFNRILEASAFSWTGLLYELERALPARVHLAEIRPDLATGQVRLHGLAATPDALELFVRRLEERPALRDVFVLHETDRTEDARAVLPGVEFRLSLVYRAPG